MIRNSDIDRLRGLFAKRLIATVDVSTRSESSRSLMRTACGGIRSVGFSSRGTLVATAEGLVNASEAGYAVEELDAIVRVGTKDVLPKWPGRKDFAALGLEIAMSTSLRRGAFVNSK